MFNFCCLAECLDATHCPESSLQICPPEIISLNRAKLGLLKEYCMVVVFVREKKESHSHYDQILEKVRERNDVH